MAVTPVVSGQWSVVSRWRDRMPKSKGHGSRWPLATGHWSLLTRGQTAIEYAVLIAVVVAAVVGMSVYAMRALSGRWRGAGDTFGYGRQYEPGTTVVSGQ